MAIANSASPTSLSVSSIVDGLATDYFFAKHVYRECGIARGHFEFLPVYTAGNGSNRTLSTSLKAVALAAYAHTYQYPMLVEKSRIYYSHAIKYLQAALTCPAEAARGSTIASMMLLGTFETLNGDDLDSLASNDVHMSGAMKTISLRANQILRSQHGLQLYLQVSWCRLVTCILRSIPVPAELIRSRRCAARIIDTHDPAWRLSQIMEKVAGFRTEVKNRYLCDRLQIVHSAFRIDQELSELTENMPSDWQYQRVTNKQDSEFVFGSEFHIYPDLWMACIWNFIRTCRLILHGEICLQLGDASHLPNPDVSTISNCLYRQSILVMDSLVSEICATVPQFCDYSTMLTKEDLGDPDVGARNSTGDDVPATASVYHLLWPLLHAGLATKSDIQREWIINRCHYIGKTTGIRQVLALADFLEKHEDLDALLERQDKEKRLSLKFIPAV